MDAERLRRLARAERPAAYAGFFWGFAEGLFFFIVPDVYISLATLFSLRAGAIAWAASIAGSAVAVSVIYALSAMLGLDYIGFLHWVPGISGSLIGRVGTSITARGLPYTPLLVLGGVPLKAYAGVAFSLNLSLGTVLLWTIFARIVRIVPAYAVVGSLRLLFRRRIEAHPSAWITLHLCFWIVFYIFYFVRMSGD
jgi:hypothetical protein